MPKIGACIANSPSAKIGAMRRLVTASILASVLLLTHGVQGANPFVDAPDNKPARAEFRGTEWGDAISEEKLPLAATVVTTRIGKMPWGGIYKIEFTDIKSSASQSREISPEYFVVTDDFIFLLNEEDMEKAVQRVSALEKPPSFDKGEIYGITRGRFRHQDGLWTTTITLRGDLCTFETSHPSGHFKKTVWKKKVGLVEYASGYGAAADGYRLKRTTSKIILNAKFRNALSALGALIEQSDQFKSDG